MRTVLTTGANSGLGLATVVEAARRGFHSVGSVRSEEKAKLVHDAALDAGVDVETVLMDVNDAVRCAEVVEELRPWGLINNAAIVDQRLVEEVNDDDAREMLETLVVAPIRLARLCLPHMRAAGEGRIVQVSSISGRVSFPKLGWYQGAKQALEGVSDALRIEVARDGIAVSIIEPGAFESPVTEEGMPLEWLRPFFASAETVASSVVSALVARVPRARYVVGVDAQINAITNPVTPTLVRDAVMRMLYGL
jgi:NAD(P)-dependent dehydrogenase (short-subunit alcohol dehydrogenase family)